MLYLQEVYSAGCGRWLRIRDEKRKTRDDRSKRLEEMVIVGGE
jgi:hypothetical protein